MTVESRPQPPSKWGRIKGLGASFAKLVTGAIAIVLAGATVFNTYQTYKSSQQSQITEQFKNGIDELGAKDESVQAGGIYTLARVAKEVPSYDDTTADAVYTVIRDFVRSNLCANRNTQDQLDGLAGFVGPPKSVDAGLQVLRENLHGGQKINLRQLRGCESKGKGDFAADMTDVDLTDVDLTGTRLSGATLEGAKLIRAVLSCTDLDGTNFANSANLTDAVLRYADITEDGFTQTIGVSKVQLRSAYWDTRVRKGRPTVAPDKQALVNGGPYISAHDVSKACGNQ